MEKENVRVKSNCRSIKEEGTLNDSEVCAKAMASASTKAPTVKAWTKPPEMEFESKATMLCE